METKVGRVCVAYLNEFVISEDIQFLLFFSLHILIACRTQNISEPRLVDLSIDYLCSEFDSCQ